MKNRLFTLTTLLALLVAMVATASASAQSPGQDVYNPNGEVLNVVQGGGSDTVPSGGTNNESGQPVKGEQGTSPSTAAAPAATPTAAPAVAKGQLPFTGFQSGLVGAAGLALLGAGVAMRRVTRKS